MSSVLMAPRNRSARQQILDALKALNVLTAEHLEDSHLKLCWTAMPDEALPPFWVGLTTDRTTKKSSKLIIGIRGMLEDLLPLYTLYKERGLLREAQRWEAFDYFPLNVAYAKDFTFYIET